MPFYLRCKHQQKNFACYFCPDELLDSEHRYYGESVVGPLTQTGLKYLTTEQALADLSNFVMQTTALGYTGKWFVFGCSYGGVLAAWFR